MWRNPPPGARTSPWTTTFSTLTFWRFPAAGITRRGSYQRTSTSGYPGCSSAMRTDSPSFTTRMWTPLSIGRTRRHTAGNYGECVCGPWVRRICVYGNICRSRFNNILWESATALRSGRFFHTQNQEEVTT